MTTKRLETRRPLRRIIRHSIRFDDTVEAALRHYPRLSAAVIVEFGVGSGRAVLSLLDVAGVAITDNLLRQALEARHRNRLATRAVLSRIRETRRL